MAKDWMLHSKGTIGPLPGLIPRLYSRYVYAMNEPLKSFFTDGMVWPPLTD